MTQLVRPLILLPADPVGDKIGGIQSFVRGFIRFAPDDFAIELVGSTSDPVGRPLGCWQPLEVAGRTIRFLPIVSTPDVHRRSRIPVALRYTVALAMRRRSVRTAGRVLQFHRAGVPLAVLGSPAARIQVVHLNVADIYSGRGESRWRLLPGMYHRLEDFTLPAMSRIFVVNQAGVDFYRRRHPSIAERVSFLPTWVDDTVFNPSEGEREATRAAVHGELGIGPNARLILFVGRLEWQKDPRLVVDGAAASLARDPDRHLVLVGDGGLRDDVRRWIAQTGEADRIHLLGFRPPAAVARLMIASDVLLLPSRYEGMPITVLEAMASGLPVVAAPVGEVPRVVVDGRTGLLIHDRTPREIGSALDAVLLRPRQSYAAELRRVVAPYRARTVLDPFYEAHREVAEDSRIARADPNLTPSSR